MLQPRIRFLRLAWQRAHIIAQIAERPEAFGYPAEPGEPAFASERQQPAQREQTEGDKSQQGAIRVLEIPFVTAQSVQEPSEQIGDVHRLAGAGDLAVEDASLLVR